VRLKEYVDKCHQMAREKGFHDEPRQLAVDIALLHSELSEVLEADRCGDWDNVVEEMADVAIRLFDTCGLWQIDLEEAIQKKIKENSKREFRHGGKKY